MRGVASKRKNVLSVQDPRSVRSSFNAEERFEGTGPSESEEKLQYKSQVLRTQDPRSVPSSFKAEERFESAGPSECAE